jgi:flagellar M-ring protein FliF
MAEETPAAPANARQENGFQILMQRIRRWSLPRKLSLLAVLVVSLALFAFIIIQARTADYQLLYGNLAEADAAATLEWLKGQNIPYKLTNNGRNIMIPSTNVHEARISLAAVGLPQGGGIGFEIFDKQSFALTDFVQKVNYGRALQGELARTISSLGPVENARVHLALPEKRLFKNQQKPATASVILKLAAGRRLGDSQVEGIVHLVSSSIEGLSPDDVTIIDQNGNVLSKKSDTGIGNLSPDMLEYQLQVEGHLEERAQALLDRAIGPKSSLVRVTANLDFAQTEKTEELFDPEEPVIRSEQVSEEKSGSEIVGGIPGVQSNLEGNTVQNSGATPPSSRSQRTTNYEISKVVSRTVNPVGTVQRISVSVLVADRVVPPEGDQPARTEPRNDTELQALEVMIASALGLDKTRGDKIEVTSMPFTDVYGEEELADSGIGFELAQFLPMIKYGGLLVAGFFVYLLMVRPMIKTLRDDVTEHFKTVREMEEEERRRRVEKENEELQALMRDPVMRVRRNVEENPVFTAHVLKNWLHDKG